MKYRLVLEVDGADGEEAVAGHVRSLGESFVGHHWITAKVTRLVGVQHEATYWMDASPDSEVIV